MTASVDSGLWKQFNVGALLFANNQCSRDILASVVANRRYYKADLLPEQTAMNDERRRPDRLQDFCVVPERRLQSFVKIGEYQPGDFIAHFTFVHNQTLKNDIINGVEELNSGTYASYSRFLASKNTSSPGCKGCKKKGVKGRHL